MQAFFLFWIHTFFTDKRRVFPNWVRGQDLLDRVDFQDRRRNIALLIDHDDDDDGDDDADDDGDSNDEKIFDE